MNVFHLLVPQQNKSTSFLFTNPSSKHPVRLFLINVFVADGQRFTTEHEIGHNGCNGIVNQLFIALTSRVFSSYRLKPNKRTLALTFFEKHILNQNLNCEWKRSSSGLEERFCGCALSRTYKGLLAVNGPNCFGN